MKTYTFTIEDIDTDLLAICLSIAANSFGANVYVPLPPTANRSETSKMVSDLRENFRNQRRAQDEASPVAEAPTKVKSWEAHAIGHALEYLHVALAAPENLERCVRPLSVALPALDAVLAPLASQRPDYKPCVPQRNDNNDK